MRSHYYKDSAGYKAIIYRVSRRQSPHILLTLYHNKAVEYSCDTFKAAVRLLKATGSDWQELPVKPESEVLNEIING